MSLLYLTSFVQHIFKIYLCCDMYVKLVPFYSQRIFHWMHVPQNIYLLTTWYGTLDYFQFGLLMSKATMNICVCLWFWFSLWKCLRTNELCGKCLTYKKLPNFFPEQLFHFTVPSSIYWVLTDSHPHQHLVLSVFLILAFLEVQWF